MEQQQQQQAPRPDEKVEELYFVGEIVGASCAFGHGGEALNCEWRLEDDSSLVHLEGKRGGQTQTSSKCVWNHPLDCHFATNSAFAKPRMYLQISSVDRDGRARVRGYGTAFLPTTSCQARLDVPCWRPVSSVRDELSHFFLGNVTPLGDTSIVSTQSALTRARSSLTTVPAGTVTINLCVLRKQQLMFPNSSS